MSRITVIQAMLNCFARANYLEVGVEDGFTFHALEAARKVAVDPVFRFDLPAEPTTPSLEYHQITSDAYFGGLTNASVKFDVIFLDGLHTFEQILRDLLNAIEHLSVNGVIVIDDVWPISYAASLPDPVDMQRVRAANPDGSEAWMGDVYRVVQFVDSFMQSYRFACTEESPWQMIMWRRPRPDVRARLLSNIAGLTYAELIKERDGMQFGPLAAILADYRNDCHAG